MKPKEKLDKETARITGMERRTRRGKGLVSSLPPSTDSRLGGVEDEDEAGVRETATGSCRFAEDAASNLRLAGRVYIITGKDQTRENCTTDTSLLLREHTPRGPWRRAQRPRL